MKIVGKDKITIADELQFILETKDTEGFLANPYQILNATIYFVSREFTDPSYKEYKVDHLDQTLVQEYEDIKKELYSKTKKSVKVTTTNEISLFGEQQIDGINLNSDDRVLVKNQSNQTENGIYVVSSGFWQRSNDANKDDKLKKGMCVFVENGISNSETKWILDCPKKITLGSTNLLFFKFSNETESLENLGLTKRLNFLKSRIESSKVSSNFFYKDAVALKIFGGYEDPETKEFFPAWLNPDYVSSDLKEKIIQENILIPYYENDEIKNGKFILNWDPTGNREGDYFICWTWMPNLTGETKSAHLFFTLQGNTAVTNSIPTHFTDPKKYEILSEKYLPDMFKTIISENDLTPRVLDGVNKSVSDGFTFVENQANQVIDLLDANATHEQMLPLLSNMFDLKLKSEDPTLWRRQIKKAIPNYKRKGTIEGLKQAFSDSGMRFLKLTKLWQVTSKYTYQEHFDYVGSNEFVLSKPIVLPIDSNLELQIRHKNGEWQDLTSVSNENWHESFVSFSENSMQWIGESLNEGDSLRIIYKIREIPTEQEQSLEDYIRSLPLMDKRDERDQDYPLKNWNVRLIEEDDDLFDIIIPVRHPLADPTVWGRIRTEFAYSENAYNMDEYNGSKRDSYDPCDIDKEFIDTCGDCQSSSFNLDIEIEKISNDTFEEARKVVEEYMPFHAVVHSFNFSGSITEFVGLNDNNIEILVTVRDEESVIAGSAQHIFNKDVDQVDIEKVKRNVLSSFESIPDSSGNSERSGKIKNSKITLSFSGTNNSEDLENKDFKNTQQNFNLINIDTSSLNFSAFDNSNLLELLTSTNKYYSVSSIEENKVNIAGVVDSSVVGPLVEYRISNLISDLNIDITQSNQILFSEDNSEFWMLGIVTEQDVAERGSSESVWTIKYGNKEYYIVDIFPNDSLLLREKATISSISGWELLKDGNVIKEGEEGILEVFERGLVKINSSNTNNLIKLKDYVYLDWESNLKKYQIKSFKKDVNNEFYIENYSEGTKVGLNCKIYRRILENKIGQLNYEGIILEYSNNLEISNNIKENYLIFSDSKYYSILETNDQELVLDGPIENWGLDGQDVDFMIYEFTNQQLELSEREAINIPGHTFDSINRSGKEIIKIKQDNALATSVSLVNLANSGEQLDFVGQSETIEYNIEYKDGE